MSPLSTSHPLEPRLDRRHAVRADRGPHPLRLRHPLVRLPAQCHRPPREEVVATAAHASGQTAKAPLLAQAWCEIRRRPGLPHFRRSHAAWPPRQHLHRGQQGQPAKRRPGPWPAVCDPDQRHRHRPSSSCMAPGSTTASAGAMGALLVAIEDDTEPANGAAENLDSLALAFAAIAAARRGEAIVPGSCKVAGRSAPLTGSASPDGPPPGPPHTRDDRLAQHHRRDLAAEMPKPRFLHEQRVPREGRKRAEFVIGDRQQCRALLDRPFVRPRSSRAYNRRS